MEDNLYSESSDTKLAELLAYLNNTQESPGTPSVSAASASHGLIGIISEFQTESHSSTRKSISAIDVEGLEKPTLAYADAGGFDKSRKDEFGTLEQLPDHEKSYVSLREMDLDERFKSMPSALEFVSIRSSAAYQGGFYGLWSVRLMRRIQDQFGFNLGNMGWLHNVLRSSTLPLDVPLLKCDITEELTNQLESAHIEALLGHRLCNVKSSVESTSFQTFSYDQNLQQDDVLSGINTARNYDFEVIDHSVASSKYCSDRLSAVSSMDQRSWQRPHAKHGQHSKTFQASSARDRSSSPSVLKRQRRRRRSSNSSSGSSTSAHSPRAASSGTPDVDVDKDMLLLRKRVDEVRKRATILQASADVDTPALPPSCPPSQDQNYSRVRTASPEITSAHLIPSVTPTTSSFHVYAGFGTSTRSLSNHSSLPVIIKASNTLTLKPESKPSNCKPAASKQTYKFDDVEIRMEWKGSLEKTIKRYMPKTDEAKFDFVGFFMECFHRMSVDLRTDLRHVVMLLNRIMITEHGKRMEFICCLTSKEIWRSYIMISGKSHSGYGHHVNSAILNALGLAFPDRVTDLRFFARNQGFLGWRLARKQYNGVFRDQKYDDLRAKLWTELNQEFFRKSNSTTYWQKASGPVIYNKLNKVCLTVFGIKGPLITPGLICVDARAKFKVGIDDELLTGTHFSMGSACLALISSAFDVSIQMKFLDDLMLLLGGGSLKRNAYNEVATEFYFDLLLARTDFLASLCKTCGNLDQAVEKLIGGSDSKEYAKVLECLVTDDAFYYNLLGWIFEKMLKTGSYESKQFLKMWSVSSSRCLKSINMSKILCQRKAETGLVSWECTFAYRILQNFTDPSIFVSKVCQSSYACWMVELLLSEKLIDEKKYPRVRYFGNKLQEHIAIGPYTPIYAEAMLGYGARPWVYENLHSITGLVFSQEESGKRATFITSMCQNQPDSELVKIIKRCVDPSQSEVVFGVASIDILYVLAIEQQQATVSAADLQQWRLGFWQSLVGDAVKMPHLKRSPSLGKLKLGRILIPKSSLVVDATQFSLKRKLKDSVSATNKLSGQTDTMVPTPVKKPKQSTSSVDAREVRRHSSAAAPLSTPLGKSKDQLTEASLTKSAAVANLMSFASSGSEVKQRNAALTAEKPINQADQIVPWLAKEAKESAGSTVAVTPESTSAALHASADKKLVTDSSVCDKKQKSKIGDAEPTWKSSFDARFEYRGSGFVQKSTVPLAKGCTLIVCDGNLSFNARDEINTDSATGNKQTYKFKNDVEIRIEWIGSLEETMKRFTAEKNQAKFDYVGFFIHCFHRMSDTVRTDLQYVAMLQNTILTSRGITFNELVCCSISKIWHSSIMVNQKCFNGYGRLANSSILNALGSAFPEKVTDLRDFGSDQGFLGWKLARQRYISVCRHKKYDAMRTKLRTQVNNAFFLKSAETSSRTKDTSLLHKDLYKMLKQVIAVAFGNPAFLITSGPVCVDVRVKLKDGNDEELLIGAHFSVNSACLTLLFSIFDVFEHMEFLYNLMLLLDTVISKSNACIEVFNHFQHDLLLARIDFLAPLCKTCGNLDPSVDKWFDEFLWEKDVKFSSYSNLLYGGQKFYSVLKLMARQKVKGPAHMLVVSTPGWMQLLRLAIRDEELGLVLMDEALTCKDEASSVFCLFAKGWERLQTLPEFTTRTKNSDATVLLSSLSDKLEDSPAETSLTKSTSVSNSNSFTSNDSTGKSKSAALTVENPPNLTEQKLASQAKKAKENVGTSETTTPESAPALLLAQAYKNQLTDSAVCDEKQKLTIGDPEPTKSSSDLGLEPMAAAGNGVSVCLEKSEILSPSFVNAQDSISMESSSTKECVDSVPLDRKTCTIASQRNTLVSVLPSDSISTLDKETRKPKDDFKMKMKCIGSLGETTKRFMPSTNQAKFDYVGFFIDCFHTMLDAVKQRDLQNVAVLLNKMQATNGITLNEPVCCSKSNIWHCSILANEKVFNGYGRLANSSILNALGLAFPEKVGDLRDFASDQGFLGWKMARRRYNSVYSYKKYDATRTKLRTQLNNAFFLKSATTYLPLRKDADQVIYKKLIQVIRVVFGNPALLITTGPVCVDVRVNLKDSSYEQLFTATHFSVNSAYLTSILSIFDVREHVKFLNAFMLLPGADYLKCNAYTQVFNDLFHYDVILARIDFLEPLCETCGNLNPPADKLMDEFNKMEYTKPSDSGSLRGSKKLYSVLKFMAGQKAKGPTHQLVVSTPGWIQLLRLTIQDEELGRMLEDALACKNDASTIFCSFAKGWKRLLSSRKVTEMESPGVVLTSLRPMTKSEDTRSNEETTNAMSVVGENTDVEVVDLIIKNLVESVIGNLSVKEGLCLSNKEKTSQRCESVDLISISHDTQLEATKSSGRPNLSSKDLDESQKLKDILQFMTQQKNRGPSHKLIVSTPGWMRLLRLAIRDEELCSTLKDAIACKDDVSTKFRSFAKRWYYLRNLPKATIKDESSKPAVLSSSLSTKPEDPPASKVHTKPIPVSDSESSVSIEGSPKKPEIIDETSFKFNGIEITMTWKDSLADTLDRFEPKFAGASFDLAGFFLECFGRMANNVRTNLLNVIFVVNECVKKHNFQISEPTFCSQSEIKVWRCIISSNKNSVTGCGRILTTAVLNALGLVCPEKIADLRYFSRDNGLVGWKSARRLYAPFSSAELKEKFWTELNSVFYLHQTSMSYCRNADETIYKNLLRVVGTTLQNNSVMMTLGPVCVDVVIVYKVHDVEMTTFVGTHFSAGGACLTLLSSMFTATELMKFLDDLMLVVGGGSMKRGLSNQVAIDFYWDLLLARIDFLKEFCETHKNIVGNNFRKKILKKFMEYLVADDAFYYNLIGWLFEGKMVTESYHEQQFLKMWDLSSSRYDRTCNLSQIISQQLALADTSSKEAKLIASLTKDFADFKIFVSKLCQSRYLYRTLRLLFLGQLVGNREAVLDYFYKVEDCISISPYAPASLGAILGNTTRELSYNSANTISGLILDQMKCKHHVDLISFMCEHGKGSGLAKIIQSQMSKAPDIFEAVTHTASRDILYPCAIEPWLMLDSHQAEIQHFSDQKVWHVAFWRTLAQDATTMPDLKWPQEFLPSIPSQSTGPQIISLLSSDVGAEPNMLEKKLPDANSSTLPISKPINVASLSILSVKEHETSQGEVPAVNSLTTPGSTLPIVLLGSKDKRHQQGSIVNVSSGGIEQLKPTESLTLPMMKLDSTGSHATISAECSEGCDKVGSSSDTSQIEGGEISPLKDALVDQIAYMDNLLSELSSLEDQVLSPNGDDACTTYQPSDFKVTYESLESASKKPPSVA